MLKVSLEEITLTGSGTAGVAPNGAGALLTSSGISGFAIANFAPTSAGNILGTGSSLQVRLFQNGEELDQAYGYPGEPNGVEWTSNGSYYLDGPGSFTAGHTVLSGTVDNAHMSDQPEFGVANSWLTKLSVSDTFCDYLQYNLNNTTWHTVGVAYWSFTGSASLSGGTWSGSTYTGADGTAVPASNDPVMSPTLQSITPVGF